MISSWYRKYKLRKDSQELVNSVKRILRSKSSSIEPNILKLANEKVSDVESSISGGDFSKIKPAYSSLKSFFEENLKRNTKSKTRQNIESVLIALALALLIRTFVVQPFKIPSGSMIPTLLVGDHLLVNKFVYGTKVPFTNKVVMPIEEIKRGDVVVFKFPNESGSKKGVHYIKRVIGLPGDVIDLTRRDIFVNGEKIPQEYLGAYSYKEESILTSTDKYLQTINDKSFDVIYRKGLISTARGRFNYPLTVPEGQIFVLGDNRDNSYDSRFWGFVPIKNISGRAFMIHWSWDLKNRDFLNKIRWERVFSKIE